MSKHPNSPTKTLSDGTPRPVAVYQAIVDTLGLSSAELHLRHPKLGLTKAEWIKSCESLFQRGMVLRRLEPGTNRKVVLKFYPET